MGGAPKLKLMWEDVRILSGVKTEGSAGPEGLRRDYKEALGF